MILIRHHVIIRSRDEVEIELTKERAKVMRTGEKVIPEDIGQRIKEQRLLNALTQGDLAKRAGLTHETISRIEAGKNVPRPTNVRKIAEALGVPVQYFTRPIDDREL